MVEYTELTDKLDFFENSPPAEKEWQSFFKQSQRVLGLFLMFTLLTAALVLAVLSFQRKSNSEIEKLSVAGTEQPVSTAAATAVPSLLVVDLAGAVTKPGVFRLPEGSRLEDLLKLADGISTAADPVWVQKNLNLATKAL